MNSLKKRWTQGLMVLLLIFGSEVQGQIKGKSWSSTTEFNWEHTGCTNNNNCDDTDPNTNDECLGSYCENSNITPSSFPMPSTGGHVTMNNGSFWIYGNTPTGANHLRQYRFGTWTDFPSLTNVKNIALSNIGLTCIRPFNVSVVNYQTNAITSFPFTNTPIDVIEYYLGALVSTTTGVQRLNMATSVWTNFYSGALSSSNRFVKTQGSVNGETWIQDQDRLLQYDGSWTVHNSTNSPLLSGTNIHYSVAINGELWVVYSGNNLVLRYDGTAWSSYNLGPNPNMGFVEAMLIGSHIVIGGGNVQYNFDGTSWNSSVVPFTFLKKPYQDNTGVGSMNSLWVNNSNGLKAYDFPGFNEIASLDFLDSSDSCFIAVNNEYVVVSNEPGFLPTGYDSQIHQVRFGHNASEDDYFSAAVNSSLNGNLLTNDFIDFAAPTNIFFGTPSSNGTIQTGANIGEFIYTPPLNFEGIDTIRYELDNGIDLDTVYLYINVSEVIIASDDTAQVGIGMTNTIDVLTNDNYTSQSVDLSVITPPLHGSQLSYWNSIRYTPTSGYLGLDSLQYQICTNPSGVQCDTAWLYIAVDQPFIFCENDTISVGINSFAWLIYILDNDSTNISNLSLGSVGTIQTPHGGLDIAASGGGYPTYHPDPFYSGIDSFQYTAYINATIRDTAWVYVNVLLDSLQAENDTLTSPVDTPISGNVLSNDYYLPMTSALAVNLLTSANHGGVSNFANGAFTYFPNSNFMGVDSFEYSICWDDSSAFCSTAWVYLNVDSSFIQANDDYLIVGMNKTLPIFTINNDITNVSSTSVAVNSLAMPLNGNVIQSGFEYVPNLNYLGLDSFQYYRYGSTPLISDTAWVYIEVIPDTLLAVNDTFSVLPNLSFSDTIINNDIFIPPSLIMYTYSLAPPANGNLSLNTRGVLTYTSNLNFFGIDSFEYALCEDSAATICDTAWVYLDVSATDSVWPGDVNLDGVVNVWDVLPIGVGFNSTGPLRPNASTNWFAQACADWNNDFANSINYKHADCDGNGEVDSLDVDVVNLNYGFVHSKGPGPKSGAGIPLYFDFNPNTYLNGSTVTGTINLGTVDTPAIDFYGIAFSLNYDNTIVDTNSVVIDFTNSWITPSANRINLDKDFWLQSKVDLATSKTDQTNSTGFGPIGTIEFNIQENLAGKTDDEFHKDLVLSFSEILAIDVDMNELDINAKNDTIDAYEIIDGIRETASTMQVKVYPNPTNGLLHILSDQYIEKLQIVNTLGQTVFKLDDPHSMQVDLDLHDLDHGIYFIILENEYKQYSRQRFIKR